MSVTMIENYRKQKSERHAGHAGLTDRRDVFVPAGTTLP